MAPVEAAKQSAMATVAAVAAAPTVAARRAAMAAGSETVAGVAAKHAAGVAAVAAAAEAAASHRATAVIEVEPAQQIWESAAVAAGISRTTGAAGIATRTPTVVKQMCGRRASAAQRNHQQRTVHRKPLPTKTKF